MNVKSFNGSSKVLKKLTHDIYSYEGANKRINLPLFGSKLTVPKEITRKFSGRYPENVK